MVHVVVLEKAVIVEAVGAAAQAATQRLSAHEHRYKSRCSVEAAEEGNLFVLFS